MSRLAAIKDGQEQMSIAEYLALDRDENPPEDTSAIEKGASMITARADPEMIRTTRAESQAGIGTETHNGDCPYTQRCESRRRRLSTYRQYQACHWLAFRNVGGCPIYQNGGKDNVT